MENQEYLPEEEPIVVEKKKSSKVKKFFLWSFLLLIIGGAGVGYYGYHSYFGETLLSRNEDLIITIPEHKANISAVLEILEEQKVLDNSMGFELAAWWLGYEGKAGRYRIPKSAKSNRDLIAALKGSQASVKITFHNFRLKEQLAGHVAKFIDTDSLELVTLLQSESYLANHGYTPQTVMSVFIPNTYELYWNTDAEGFFERMLKEHEKFWAKNDRLAKAEALGLTPTEVYTLASIVETESQYKPERPTIAGVYLNRLKEDWLLQADPTVVFAVGDFSIRRVLNRHLEVDSPYNTYKYEGLPPGPIYMASISSIDAVLDYEHHEYMFFCAKPGGEGQHSFARTLRQHTNNARAYHRWLNQQGR